MITRDTTIARLLEEHPQLLEFLASYHAHFEKLRSRLLRRVMAPRVTVADAARIAGIAEDELLGALRRAAGVAQPAGCGGDAGPGPAWAPTPRPTALGALPATERVDLDVRDDIRRGEEPFARIMAAVKALGLGQALVLRTPFEPVPLYEVLGKRGLAHWTERHAPDDWSVWFYREPAAATGAVAPAAAGHAASTTLDVRGLEAPLPMQRVLERLEDLGAGETLEVIHSRRPLFLYPQLDDRGFAHETDEPEPGVVRIRICRSA
jgi:uncharacterized protein (DUF2249 family)